MATSSQYPTSKGRQVPSFKASYRQAFSSSSSRSPATPEDARTMMVEVRTPSRRMVTYKPRRGAKKNAGRRTSEDSGMGSPRHQEELKNAISRLENLVEKNGR